MAEGVSSNVILRSYQASLKRVRTEDPHSGGYTRLSKCGYLRCRRPGRPLRSEGADQFCSVSHQDYCMADRFDKQHAGSHGATEQPRGELCMLPGCDSGLWVIDPSAGEAYDFCRKKHALTYRQQFTELWALQGRLCKFDNCQRHVRVDEPRKKIYEYCGDDHEFAAAGVRGILAAKRKRMAAANAISWLPQVHRLVGPAESNGGKGPAGIDELWRCIPQESSRQDFGAMTEQERGYHEKVLPEAMEHCMKHLLLRFEDFENADPGGNFCIGTNVTQSNPWHVVQGFTARFFVHYIDSEPGRQRTTSQGFGWKQTSCSHKNKSTNKRIETTYFFYEWRGKADNNDQSDGPEGVYRQYENDRKAGKLKTKEKSWRMYQYGPSAEFVKQVIGGGQFPSKKPVISKIFQNKHGEPVYPPLAQRKETQAMDVVAKESFAPVLVPMLPDVTLLVEERAMTSSSIASNASSEGLPPEAVTLPPGHSLPHGGKTVQQPHSNDTEVPHGFACLQDTDVELIQYQSKAPISVGTKAVAASLAEERGMTSSISSNSSSEGLPHQGEGLLGSNSIDTEELLLWNSLTDDNNSLDAGLYQDNFGNCFDWVNAFQGCDGYEVM